MSRQHAQHPQKMAFEKLWYILRACIACYFIYVLIIQSLGILHDFITQIVFVMMKLAYVTMSGIAIRVVIDITNDE